MKIPVRNLWLLQLFASDLYRTHGTELAGAEELPEDLPKLVAKMLADEVTTRLHSGLSVGFTRTAKNLRRVRGRIDVLETERHLLLEKGMVRCRFDEVVTDTPGNRLIKAALRKSVGLIPDNSRYQSLVLQLEVAGVTGPPPRVDIVPALKRQRLLAQDHRMLSLAELLLTMSVPDPGQDEFVTVAPDDSDRYLQKLFEHAAYGFYRYTLEPRGWSVRHGSRLEWNTDFVSEAMGSVLPGMYTDITLREPRGKYGPLRRRVVIDTKFTSVTYAAHYRPSSLDSAHLYQIYAYLMSQGEKDQEHRQAEGLMLHPVVDGNFDEEVVIQGHRIRFATVDLCASHEVMIEHLARAITRRETDRFIPKKGIMFEHDVEAEWDDKHYGPHHQVLYIGKIRATAKDAGERGVAYEVIAFEKVRLQGFGHDMEHAKAICEAQISDFFRKR